MTPQHGLPAALLLSLVVVIPLPAQGPRLRTFPAFHRAAEKAVPPTGSMTPSLSDATRTRDHRWEGLAVGAALVGVSMGVVGHDLCKSDSQNRSCFGTTVGFTLLGATVGGVVGGFLGRMFPKHDPPT
jgi:hypothetical protein